MRLRRWLLSAAAGGLGLVLGVGTVSADTIQVTNAGITDNDIDSQFEFRYSAALVNSPPSQINSGDYFQIFDFEGFTGLTYEPSNWAFSFGDDPVDTSVSGFINTSIGDDLRWTYTGSTPITASGGLGFFGAETTAILLKPGFFLGRDTNPNLTPSQQTNFGPVLVPTLDPSSGTSFVPLPAAAWGGMGLFGLLGGMRLRKSQKA
jgi:hypothetical protein